MQEFSLEKNEQPPHHKLDKIKQNLHHKQQSKYMAQTMTQNFFSHQNSEDFAYISSALQQHKTLQPEQTKRKNKASVKLQPMKQKGKTDTFEIKSNRGNVEDHFNEQALNTVFDRKGYNNIQQQSGACLISHENFNEETVLPLSNQIGKNIQNVNQSQYFNEWEQKIKQIQKRQQNQDSSIPKRVFAEQYAQEPENLSQSKEKQENNKKIISYVTGSEYFNFSSTIALLQDIYSDVRNSKTLRMQIIRDKGGFNTFWPQFHLQFVNDKRYLLSAKKTSSRPTSTFIMSISKSNFEENSSHYLGKMRSSTLGQSFNIYGPGLNPSNAKQKKAIPRELLATVIYNTSLFQASGPRKFSVYIKRPEFKYYEDFPQVKIYQQETPLNILYTYDTNKQKIRCVHNRKPQFIQSLGGYMMNFRGKAQCLSVKNFILQQQNGAELVLFGKASENVYNLQVSSNISPYLAFSIAISSFDSRLIFQ